MRSARITELENRLSLSVRPLRDEIQRRPVNEWSAALVLCWVEHVFRAEHETAQITELLMS